MGARAAPAEDASRQEHRLELVVRSVAGLALLASAAGVVAAAASPVPVPSVYRLAIGAGAFLLGDVAVLHLRFGHNQWSLTWAETALVIGLVVVPQPYLRVAAGIGVACAHLLARRPLRKVVFNAGVAVLAVAAAREAYILAGGTWGSNPAMPRTWLALGAAAITFFVVNTLAVSWVVALSQRMPLAAVVRKGLLFNLVAALGNTALGILVVTMLRLQPASIAFLPLLLSLLFVLYQSYLRAMRETDVWRVLEASSRELLQVEEHALAEVVVHRTRSLLGAEWVELLVVDEDGGPCATAYRLASSGEVTLMRASADQLGETYWGRLRSEREPFSVSIDSPAPQRRELEELGLVMAHVAPLVTADRCIGALRIGFRGPIRIGARESQVFTTFANNVSAALHTIQLFETMREQALHDPLTGLPNRALLLDRLDQALVRTVRTGRMVGLLFLDLDRFKVVNDSLGHAVGDELLVAAAARITACLRPGDTVTRFGGDEFVIVCEELHDAGAAQVLADRIVLALSEPFVVAGSTVYATASVGVAVAGPGGHDAQALLRDADAAMYRAKELGRSRSELFDVDMRTKALSRLETERDLRVAVDQDQLRLLYQPLFTIASQQIAGCEALVRWQRPGHPLVGPDDFILLAEETGLIDGIGAWVLGEACSQLGRWARTGADSARFHVAVNLSPHQLLDARLVERVAGALHHAGADPGGLVLEITESALVEDLDKAREQLVALRRLGVRIALDDFGTGYSALSYLHRLPVDVVKIDRSFTTRLATDDRDAAIVAGIIDLAHGLGLTVVAEGVETPVQLAELARMGCDLAQGFYFARPDAPAAVEALLRAPAIELEA